MSTIPPPPDPPDDTVVVDQVEEEAPPPRRPPQLWPWLLALLVLVLGGLLAWWLLLRDDEKTVVPAVVGLTEEQARARLAEAELEAAVERQESERAAGVVFAQTPGGGTQLDEGQTVELLVSSGLTQVPVPNVLGLQEAEAVDRLEDAELTAKVQRVFAGAPNGIVVEQAPQSGERAASGATVAIKVSKGRNTTTTGQTTTGQTTTGGTTTGQTAPNVVGLAQTPALRQLDAEGFRGVVSYRVSNRPRGVVIEQAGTAAGPDQEVGLVVSAGATEPEVVVVEDVRGLDEAEARDRLEGAGFRVEVIRRGEGAVTDQQPEPDVSAPRGAVVTLFVGSP